MRRALLVLAAASLALGVTTASAAPEKAKWARGKVTAMAGDTLTIDVKGQSMMFTVDKTTEVVKSGAGTKAREMARTGETPKLSDVLKVGDEVEVSYTEADGKMHATMVRGGVSAPAMTSAEAAQKMEGVVSEVSGSSLSIKSKDGETVNFVVDEKTKVVGHGLGTMAREKKAEGQGVKLTDAVAVGDTVNVTYKMMGDMKHATHVAVAKKGSTN
jgi:hypothetical protein